MKFYILFIFILIAVPTSLQSQDLNYGSQTWAAKDLDVLFYNNGDPITKAESSREWNNAYHNSEGAYCTYNGQILYNWYAVNDSRGLAPSGYHVPSYADWLGLLMYLGEPGELELKIGVLKKSGFYQISAGGRDTITGLSGYGKWSTWWTSDNRDDSNAYICQVYFYLKGAHLTHLGGNFSNGHAVRCIKNNK